MRVPIPDEWPVWMEALHSTLQKPLKDWRRPSRLSFIEVLLEVRAYADSRREFDFHVSCSWKQLLNDLEASLEVAPKRIGIQFRLAVDVIVSAVREICKLPTKSKDLAASKKRFSNLREEVGLQNNYLLKQLEDLDEVERSWDDLVTACRSDNSDSDSIETCRDHLWRVARFQAYDLDSFGVQRLISDILADQAFSIALIDPESINGIEVTSPIQMAGLSAEERISVSRSAWGVLRETADHVVWLAYEYAPMSRSNLRIGSADFLPVDWISSDIANGEIVLGNVPPEIRENVERIFWGALLNGQNHTLVRVALPGFPKGKAISLARESVEAILDLCSGVSRQSWIPFNGHLHFIDGSLVSTGWFASSPGTLDGVFDQNTDFALDRISRKWGNLAPIRNDKTRRVIDTYRTVLEAKEANLSTQVMAYQHAMENAHKLAQLENSWEEFAREYLKDRWVLSQLRSYIYYSIRSDFEVPAERRFVGLEAGRAYALAESLQAFRFGRGEDELDRIVDCHLENLHRQALSRKYLLNVRNLLASEGATEYLDVLDKEFEILLTRLKRHRNAITHGGPVRHEGVQTVRWFGIDLAVLCIRGMLDGILGESEDIKYGLQSLRSEAREERGLVEGNGSSPLLTIDTP